MSGESYPQGNYWRRAAGFEWLEVHLCAMCRGVTSVIGYSTHRETNWFTVVCVLRRRAEEPVVIVLVGVGVDRDSGMPQDMRYAEGLLATVASNGCACRKQTSRDEGVCCNTAGERGVVVSSEVFVH